MKTPFNCGLRIADCGLKAPRQTDFGFRISDFGFRIGSHPSDCKAPHPLIRNPQSAIRNPRAFTLLELLVVIVIMGLLATLGLPAIKGMSKSNSMAAANRQMLDDLAYARQRAIADHTTVYMVFVPTNIMDQSVYPTIAPTLGRAITNLYHSQYTTYALLSLRSVGDQPGQPHPRYLTSWRSLPDGVFIPPAKFIPTLNSPIPVFPAPVPPTLGITGNPNYTGFPFPYVTNTVGGSFIQAPLPYIGFDYLGRLVSQRDEIIPLVHGSIFYPIGGGTDIQENPPYADIYNQNTHAPYYPNNGFNQIHIDWLTGHARVEKSDF